MESIKKILYVGTGLHIQPTVHFRKVKEFVFIDTQPRTKMDNPRFYKACYQSNFYDELIDKCRAFGFEFSSMKELDSYYYRKIMTIKQRLYYSLYDIKPQFINPTLITFINPKTKQTIKYYISTNIEYNMTDELVTDIKDSCALIVSGYHPSMKLLKYFTKPKIFIGYSDTSYDFANNLFIEETDNIIYMLNKKVGINSSTDIKTTEYFSKYFLIFKFSGQVCECEDIFDLKVKIVAES